ncbi:MAG: RRM domain-containing RNA-binding protein [candidate division CPR2 bacterium GW2011_GWC1_39_9]|uniref:RRM domain-containing RNA-binding protein n=1 Tax=candidate division CPR2 bacterium GW2011_GWC2_39_10 TaxID=1618345 RepID=A0A0G0LWL9_UNCC2|nr:MAG: RRM domain-containing RNA-binding protein [candidate division CPR2 bacterium GW2011_GWC2_39_10]KKR36198.1 MAG: RRM domain-containing RNA-binding protein [candidate division CPR2 bacterium GW2011_GWC1_39_9]
MASKLFVGNLPYTVDNKQLEEMFADLGTVVSANVVMDKFSDRSKGFGFVEMSSEEEAKAAVDKLDGSEVNGRKMVVNIARPQVPRN